jgi:glycosyltransferase involved in cell wall biosynthesis/tetratricopeptide (TPR) repeat protein
VGFLRRAVELKSDVAEFNLGLGAALVRLGSASEEAEACLRRAVELNPFLAEAFYFLGVAASGRGQWSEAVEFYGRGLEVNPSGVECGLGLAEALGKLGRWSEAVQKYRQMELASGPSGEVCFGLGQALGQLGRWEEAVVEYRRAVALGFAGAEVRHHLGYALGQLGRWEEGVVEYRLVVEVNPKSAPVRHQLGYALMRLGRWGEAAVELRRSVELYPGSAVVWQQLGDVLRELGEDEEAVGVYGRALLEEGKGLDCEEKTRQKENQQQRRGVREDNHQPKEPAIRGFVDQFLDGYIWGWVKDLNNDNKHLSISLYIDKNKICVCTATLQREDLKKAGIDPANCGFKFAVPDKWLDGKEHIIEIRVEDGTPIIEGQPCKSLLLSKKPDFSNLPWRYTGIALNRSALDGYFRVVFVSHMSNMTGAPVALLSLVKEVSKGLDFDCRVILHEDGPLSAEFARFAPTIFLHDLQKSGASKSEAIKILASYVAREDKRTVVICNTIATQSYMDAFTSSGVPIMPWIHELPTSIDEFSGGKPTIDKVSNVARTIVTPAEMVRNALIDHYNVPPAKVVRYYYGTYAGRESFSRQYVRRIVREEFGLPSDALIVLGCGTFDNRKGGDLFVSVANRTLQKTKKANVWFIWVGDAYDKRFFGWCQHDAKILGLGDRIIFAGLRSNAAPYFQAADVFALTSREDPFPLVNMEAMAYGLPVVAFEDGGGAPEALTEGRGIVVPYMDVNSMGDAINSLLLDKTARQKIGKCAANYMRDDFTWSRFADNIVDELRDKYGYCERIHLSVSVIIPNYNHAEYLPQRIESIVNQTRLPDEIIFLDDASDDGSLAIAQKYAAQSPVPFRVVVNDVNNGSTFKQWLKGFSLVKSDLVWIAESDDWCETNFLERLVPEFYDRDVMLAFCQSVIAGPQGEIYAPDYTKYTKDISETRWLSHYSVSSAEEAEVALSQKNTIPNVSAVVFRRPELSSITPSLLKYRLCGDWWFYLWRIRDGKISFIPKPLNYHRRHPKTVTHNIEKDTISIEEALMVKAELFEREDIPYKSICRSLALTMYEYKRLSRLHRLSRPELMENPQMEDIISRIRCRFNAVGESKGLRILIVLPDLEVGGGQIAAIRLANAMSVDNTVFLINARPDRYDCNLEETIDNRLLFLEGTLGSTPWATDLEPGAPTHNNLAEGQARLSVLINLAKFHRIEIIHTHVWWADRLGFHLSKSLKIPWVIHMHGSYEDLLNRPEADLQFNKLLAPMMKTVAGVIYGSVRNLEVFQRYPELKLAKLAKIFNGFDASKVEASKGREFHRQKGIMKFCLCSRAIPEKGWEQAINAVLNINSLPARNRGNRKAHLILIGGGPFADALREKFNSVDSVEFHGQMAQPIKAIKDCDVGLLPSYFVSETVPSTVIEYLACGLPVIATDVGCIPEMIKAGNVEAGLILPLSPQRTIDVDKLTSLLLRYMINDKLFQLHSKNASQVFTSLFDISKIKSATLAMYNFLLT